MWAASAFADPTSPPWQPGPVLTLYPNLLQLRHLGDGLLQVFHELLHLIGAQGAEVQHLLLLGA